MKIILGSKSPRRKELLSLLGLKFEIVVSDVDEEVEYTNYVEMVEKIAQKKADFLLKNHQDSLVICADTIVICNDMVLGKPKDKQDARRMISMLSDNVHEVYTAVNLTSKSRKVNFVEKTKVFVSNLTDDEIEEYINTDEPYDKAGAYGIQGIFARFIYKIEGDYYNVMGLPVSRLYHELKQFS